jgi:hypothetical protein
MASSTGDKEMTNFVDEGGNARAFTIEKAQAK